MGPHLVVWDRITALLFPDHSFHLFIHGYLFEHELSSELILITISFQVGLDHLCHLVLFFIVRRLWLRCKSTAIAEYTTFPIWGTRFAFNRSSGIIDTISFNVGCNRLCSVRLSNSECLLDLAELWVICRCLRNVLDKFASDWETDFLMRSKLNLNVNKRTRTENSLTFSTFSMNLSGFMVPLSSSWYAWKSLSCCGS